jgi:transcriptional regulator with XRE-family HTH domain
MAMAQTVQQRISLLMKAKRRELGNLGVREAAKLAKISAATFSRLGSGTSETLPDVATLTKLAKWLGMSIGDLLNSGDSPQSSGPQCTTPELVEVHLRADKNLSPDMAQSLAKMFASIYNEVAKNRPPAKS